MNDLVQVKANALTIYHHGDVVPLPPPWAIYNKLPEQGTGLLSGLSSFFKTYILFDLFCALMTGTPWLGGRVYRRSGSLLIAAEGAYSVPSRMQAIVQYKLDTDVINQAIGTNLTDFGEPIDSRNLPFSWSGTCPLLLDPKSHALEVLTEAALVENERQLREFGIPLGLIAIDTLSAGAGFVNENDNAEAAEVMALLRKLSEATGAFVMAADHLNSTGAKTRGATAKVANADLNYVVLGHQSPGGIVTGTKLWIKKMRDGPQGMPFPFTAPIVPMGKDAYGEDLTQRVIEWNAKAADHANRPRTPREMLFDEALRLAVETAGEPPPDADGDQMLINSGIVRDLFVPAYCENQPAISIKSARGAFYRILETEIEFGRVTVIESRLYSKLLLVPYYDKSTDDFDE